MILTHRLPVPTDTPYRLGRHVRHDDESWDHRFTLPALFRDTTTVWPYTLPVLNQLNTNSCTGNAMAGFFNTDYAAPTRTVQNVRWVTEKTALKFYSVATHENHDPSDDYPPHDEGSTGLDVAKAARDLGWITSYEHCFSFRSFRAALQSQPVLVGTVWTNDMFEPDAHNVLHPGSLDGSNIAGGHEYLALEIHYDTRLLTFLTSWGQGFGRRGTFQLSFDDFQALLALQGDVTVPHGVGMR